MAYGLKPDLVDVAQVVGCILCLLLTFAELQDCCVHIPTAGLFHV